jgi:hypothetical protein
MEVSSQFYAPAILFPWKKPMAHINPLTPELNPSAQRCLTRFLLEILFFEPRISLIYA